MATLTSNKFSIGDYVFLRGDNQPWFVSGLRLHCGYDVFSWEYFISRTAYTNLDQNSEVKLYWKCDYDTKQVRDDQLVSPDEHAKSRREELLAKQAELEDELTALKAQLDAR